MADKTSAVLPIMAMSIDGALRIQCLMKIASRKGHRSLLKTGSLYNAFQGI